MSRDSLTKGLEDLQKSVGRAPTPREKNPEDLDFAREVRPGFKEIVRSPSLSDRMVSQLEERDLEKEPLTSTAERVASLTWGEMMEIATFVAGKLSTDGAVVDEYKVAWSLNEWQKHHLRADAPVSEPAATTAE